MYGKIFLEIFVVVYKEMHSRCTFPILRNSIVFQVFSSNLGSASYLQWRVIHKTLRGFYVQFSFVRYSVYIILRVIIQVSPKKKLTVVCATQVVDTIVYILYKLWSAECIIIPTVCIRPCKHTGDITNKYTDTAYIRSINCII